MGSTLSSTNSNPLFSVFVSFYLIVVLYAPRVLLRLLFSPVLLSTGILLAGILHLGKKDNQSESSKAEPHLPLKNADSDEKPTESEPNREDGERCEEKDKEKEVGFWQQRQFSDTFFEWHRCAPLEVIYEEHEEGEDDHGGDDVKSPEYCQPFSGRGEAYSLELCYSESESDISSDDSFPMVEWEKPENDCFRWEEEKEEGLIEIPIFVEKDTCRSEAFFSPEEDNLIEIDLLRQTVSKNSNFRARIQAATQC